VGLEGADWPDNLMAESCLCIFGLHPAYVKAEIKSGARIICIMNGNKFVKIWLDFILIAFLITYQTRGVLYTMQSAAKFFNEVKCA
jgi:hypothetical protein